jgi:signal peptidase I
VWKSEPQRKPLSRRGKVRDNLEAFGIAILAAVLLKYFAIEAYQIPTSSMQPTLMGSVEAGVHDRILVDKVHYAFTDPDRWDVAVFRYPLQQNQNYVKRIVGIPGDRLRIHGGNIYQVDKETDKVLKPLRKPNHIQERLWKEVYPLRRYVTGSDSILNDYFHGVGKWREDGEDLIVDAGDKSIMLLTFSNTADSGLVNQVSDGYPVGVSRMIRTATGPRALLAVPDVRLSMTVTPGQQTAQSEIELQLAVYRTARETIQFSLQLRDGQGQLLVRRGDRERDPVLSGELIPFELLEGEETEVAFAHLDDELIAWREGEEVARLDTSDHRILDGLEVPSASVTSRIQIKGGGETRLSDLRLERDLHYTRSTLSIGENIDVPEGHYFMMGDNTLQSVDSRDWTAVTVGLLPDGRMVDPNKHADARPIRGNKRPMAPSGPPDRDETPIVIPTEDTVVMIDEFGNVKRMKSGISPAYSPDNMLFEVLGGSREDDWKPEEVKVQVVPREHVIGRALIGFWPFPPFGPNRVGFIR